MQKIINKKIINNMSTERLITVFGATGSQGGAVVSGLLAKGGYKIRGITRNPDGEKATQLRSKGVEIVQASLDDPASIQTAIAGSYGVFLVTNFWEFMNKEREIQQGKATADACKKVNVSHLVYSGLELVRDITGKECPHFDGKGEIEKYLDEISLPNTSIRVSFYYQNFKFFAQKTSDRNYLYTSSMKGPMDAISVGDIGHAVASIFSQPDEFIGKKVGLTGDCMTMEEYCAIIAKVTGVTFKHAEMSFEDYSALFPGSSDLAAMFDFYEKGSPDRSIPLTKSLNPNTKNFTQWVEENKDIFLN